MLHVPTGFMMVNDTLGLIQDTATVEVGLNNEKNLGGINFLKVLPETRSFQLKL